MKDIGSNHDREAQAPSCLQFHSPFFSKLPLEIRDLIYHFAYPFAAVHISSRNRVPSQDEHKQDSRIGSTPCLTNHDFSLFELDGYDEPDIDWGRGHQACLQDFKHRYQKRSLTEKILSLRISTPALFVNMMLACRRM
jgi:hypothetical protein